MYLKSRFEAIARTGLDGVEIFENDFPVYNETTTDAG